MAVADLPRGNHVASASLQRAGSLVALATVVAIGAGLRISYLGAWSLWIDESTSVWIARLRWPDFFRTLAHDETNMALYYVLLRSWLHLGDGEFIIRSLSVLFSLATIPVVYALGCRLFGRRAGFIAALLMAINAFAIRYAQETRGYSLVVFLVSLASWYFLDAVQQPSRRGWTAYATAMALGLYSHVFAAFVFIAHWCALACVPPRRVVWRGMAASTFVIGLLGLPFALRFVTGNTASLNWIPKPTMHSLLGVVPQLIGLRENGPRWQSVLFLPFLVLIVAALVLAMRAWIHDRRSETSWHYGVVVAWLSVPVILALIISAVQPIFLVRYLSVSLPPLILLVAAAVASAPSRTLFRAAAGALVLCSSVMVVAYYRHGDKADWRAATHHVLSHAQPGDVVVFYTHPGQLAFDYYREREAATLGSALTEFAVPGESAILFAKGQDVMGSLPVQHARQVWLVLSHVQVGLRTPAGNIDGTVLAAAIRRYLSRSRTLATRTIFQGDIRVLLYR